MKDRLLRVNLTHRTFREEAIPADVLQRYIGGKGLAAWYAYREIPPGTDPMGAGNKLFVFVGPLTSVYHVYSRHVIAAKSPLTHTFSDSYAGGWFGAELARTRYAGIIIEGRADGLVYLKIDGPRVSIEDARHLAGKNPYEVDALFADSRVATIGPAGERLVKFACVANDASRRQRAGVAGRGGIGAVFGSKNLKAIVVRGEFDPRDIVPEAFREDVAGQRKVMLTYLKQEVSPGFGLGGNLPAMKLTADARVLPVGNFAEGHIEGYEQVAEQAFREVTTGKTTCYLCPVACGVHVQVKEGRFAGVDLDRIEYETVALNGPNCRQLDIGAIIKIGRLCNEYGMDTISIGNITAFVMECSAKGLLDYRLDYGDADGQIRLIEMIGRREGLGDILAEGLRSAARTLGLEKYAVEIKGLEIPGYDVRGPVGMALAYATADRGGDHLRAWTIVAEQDAPFTTRGKAQLTKDLQDRNAALWCLIGCDNIPANSTTDSARFVDHSIRILNSLGWNLDADGFREVGERTYNLTRLFNVREGFARKDDALPPRFYEPREDTGWTLAREDFERMLDDYYAIRGWDAGGRPTPQTLGRLGIEA
jgi:aldehyde:ferredoxin oxidoreductase